MSERVDVRKTYKLFVGGAFPRSESGRTYEALDSKGRFVANVARASRKDARDAVVAARKAFTGWSARTPYNRGQILYRIAEMLEGRREQFISEVAATEGVSRPRATTAVDVAIDRWVWYAGWADKLAQILGSSNPVAGSYFNFTIPEPMGVVGVVAPEEPALLGLVSRVAPAIVGGNAVIVLASERRPIAAMTLAEVLATSDVPGGVVNILTGRKNELSSVLASHLDVNAIDLAGVDGDRAELERLAAENVKRVVRNGEGQSPWHAAAFLEMKTVWHPIGV